MVWILCAMYVWAGLTAAYGLWQIEEVGEAVNGLMTTAGIDKPPLRRHLNGRPAVWVIVIVAWPAIAPMWAWHSWRHNA